ncbi:MAG: type II toxin-antitoxin system prevent-host-death family antitoxin [Rhizobiaceae bacterium]|nr:type II toxin-antitoxin system prevent-host-death family antitoxin [Rhizobiaceae bacterium]MCV0407732.1 type II toxin-antitoxin system prevent-host-death family antitoxin [Rhizobiaceae bacterium]
MREVGVLEARNSLSALLERVEKGEEFTITRHGKPVARLMSAQTRDVEKAREAASAIREMRKRVKPDPDGLSVRDYVEMGRRY